MKQEAEERIATCQNRDVLQAIYNNIPQILSQYQKSTDFNIGKKQAETVRARPLGPTEAAIKMVEYIQPFLDVLHSQDNLKINQGRARVIIKNVLLRKLIEHYGKFKTTQDGAALLIYKDLEYFEANILRYKLIPEEDTEAQSEIELNQGTVELLKAFVRLYSEEPKGIQSAVNLIFELSGVKVVTRGADGQVCLKRKD